MAPRKPLALDPSLRQFCESCRDYHASKAALRRHNNAVHKPLRGRRPVDKYSDSSMIKPNEKSFATRQTAKVGNDSDEDNATMVPSPISPSKVLNEKEKLAQEFSCLELGCLKKFSSELVLLDHKKFHEEKFKCHECQEMVQRIEYFTHLNGHAEMAGNVEPVYEGNLKNSPSENVNGRVGAEIGFFEILGNRFLYNGPETKRKDPPLPPELFLCRECHPPTLFFTEKEFESHSLIGIHPGAFRIK